VKIGGAAYIFDAAYRDAEIRIPYKKQRWRAFARQPLRLLVGIAISKAVSPTFANAVSQATAPRLNRPLEAMLASYAATAANPNL
jgi:hypothetical protein